MARLYPRFSVIIPTLNEADCIQRTLSPVLNRQDVEVLVADGGSSDQTQAFVESMGASLLSFPAGKARQMNGAASSARGGIFLFLHADTELPPSWRQEVLNLLEDENVMLGAFQLAIDQPGRGLRIIEKAANLRSRYLSLPYGDQALFLRAEIFRELGGFPEIPIMEDFELVRRARRRGRIAIAAGAVKTSGRRWRKRGLIRTTLLNWSIVVGYYLGLSPERLARWY